MTGLVVSGISLHCGAAQALRVTGRHAVSTDRRPELDDWLWSYGRKSSFSTSRRTASGLPIGRAMRSLGDSIAMAILLVEQYLDFFRELADHVWIVARSSTNAALKQSKARMHAVT